MSKWLSVKRLVWPLKPHLPHRRASLMKLN